MRVPAASVTGGSTTGAGFSGTAVFFVDASSGGFKRFALEHPVASVTTATAMLARTKFLGLICE
jgi:hypothetical protein